jgi:hypothetical protein
MSAYIALPLKNGKIQYTASFLGASSGFLAFFCENLQRTARENGVLQRLTGADTSSGGLRRAHCLMAD